MKRLLLAFILAVGCTGTVLADSAADALASARSHLSALTSYRLVYEEDAGTTQIDYTAPDRLRITSPQAETLMIGGAVWLKGDSGWSPAAVNARIELLLARVQSDEPLAVNVGDTVSDGGTETIAGTAMHRYLVVSGSDSSVRRSIWISVKTGLPFRVVKSVGDSRLTASYSAFGKDFGIVAPGKLDSTLHS
ncbi:MAG TPA: hypothetical protein VGD50_03680 [Candidatus Baltobacteraceae bacterium]